MKVSESIPVEDYSDVLDYIDNSEDEKTIVLDTTSGKVTEVTRGIDEDTAIAPKAVYKYCPSNSVCLRANPPNLYYGFTGNAVTYSDGWANRTAVKTSSSYKAVVNYTYGLTTRTSPVIGNNALVEFNPGPAKVNRVTVYNE